MTAPGKFLTKKKKKKRHCENKRKSSFPVSSNKDALQDQNVIKNVCCFCIRKKKKSIKVFLLNFEQT